MSSHKSMKTSLERAKTSLGLKSSNRERMESVSELMVALEKERQLEQVMMKSVEQWTEIVNEITSNMDSATTSESEWKTRFHDQRLFNQMLIQEIGQIKTELFTLKEGDTGMTLPVMGESKSSRSKYCRQSQAYINGLEKKLKSLESLYNMYEHQLDDASRDYHRLKEEINKIVKDVSYKQKAMIKRQEESDQKKIAASNLAMKLPGKVTVLPPLKSSGGREKISYLKLHEVKSVVGKPVDSGKNQQSGKGVGKLPKLPPIDSTKNNEKLSKKPQSAYVVQEEWKRVTKKDLLVPIWSGNREEDDKSNISIKVQDRKNVKTCTDSKLPSLRSRRIANLGTGSDNVTFPAIRKGKKAKTTPGTVKKRTDTHQDWSGHVNDQRAGSTDELSESGKGTGHNTGNPTREISGVYKERRIHDANKKPIQRKENYLHGLSSRPSTRTTPKPLSRNSERNGEIRRVSHNSQHKRKTDTVSKSTMKTLPDIVASPQQQNVTERHEHQFPVYNDGHISNPSRKRLKSTFVRSNSRNSKVDDREKNISPIELQVSPSNKDSQLSVVHKDTMSPLSVTVDERVDMADDTSDNETGRNSSEHRFRSTEKVERDPGTKRKSVTISDKTTIHFP